MKSILLIPALLLMTASWAFPATAEKPKLVGQIITVLGPIAAEDFGTVLPHEHVMVDFIGAAETGPHRWDQQTVIDRALPFLMEAKAHGCQGLVECTPNFVGRDPVILKALSEQTRLHLLTNTGLYGAVNDRFIPEAAWRLTAEQLAQQWIREFEHGIGDTGIRPGFIKIAVDRDPELSEVDAKLVRAAVLTHQQTGLVIMSHTGPDAPAFAQIKLLQTMGASPNAFIWTHAQHGTFAGWVRAANLGAWISLDNVKPNTVKQHATNLAKLKAQGLLHRVLISHDSGWYRVGEANGGQYNGYTTLFTHLIPRLKEHGLTEQDLKQLLVINPARAFAIQPAEALPHASAPGQKPRG